MSDVPAYLIAQVRVKDYGEYIQRYAALALPQFAPIGAEVIVATPSAKCFEGEWGCNWTVVIRFPSMAVAEQWYNSAEYTPLRELRRSELSEGGNLVLVEGFDPAALASLAAT